MEERHHHEELVAGISEQLRPVLDKSAQAIYVYMDDDHKFCNKRFADLVGYKSAEEWAGTEAPLADVVAEDQPAAVAAYEDAMEKLVASDVEVRFKNIKTGRVVRARMILVPFSFEGHLFSLHFLSRV